MSLRPTAEPDHGETAPDRPDRAAVDAGDLDAFPDALLLVDRGGVIVSVNDRLVQLSGYAREELVGKPVELLVPEHFREHHVDQRTGYLDAPRTRSMGSGLLLELRARDGRELPVEIGLSPWPVRDDGDVLAVVRDATRRKRVEDRLHRQLGAQSMLAQLSMEALADYDLHRYFRIATQLLADHLDADLVTVIEVTDGDLVRLRAHAGELPPAFELPPSIHDLPQASYTLRTRGATLVRDVLRERRFRSPGYLIDAGFRSTMSAVVSGHGRPFGLVCVHATEPSAFGPDDLDTLQVASSIVSACVDRVLSERRAEDELARFVHFAEAAEDVIFRFQLEPEMRCLYVNAALQRVLGYDPADWYSHPELMFEIAHPDDPSIDWRQLAATDSHRHLGRFRDAEGYWRWIEVQVGVTRSAFGRVQSVQGIGRDVTDRQHTQQALEAALERERAATDSLRELDEMKNAFLQAVSHELRTPLTVIRGLADTISQRFDELDRDSHELMSARIAANAARLEGLLADLLDVDRLARGVIEPRREPVDLVAVATTIVDELQRDDHVVLVSGDGVVAHVDRAMLERIVENLVGNALKHTPPGTTVRVELERDGDTAVVAVSDDGQGIPDELKATVLEPFAQGPSSSAHSQGSGIGLALVVRFAELHGGSVEVADAPGRGARIVVRLPDGGSDPA